MVSRIILLLERSVSSLFSLAESAGRKVSCRTRAVFFYIPGTFQQSLFLPLPRFFAQGLDSIRLRGFFLFSIFWIRNRTDGRSSARRYVHERSATFSPVMIGLHARTGNGRYEPRTGKKYSIFIVTNGANASSSPIGLWCVDS